MTDQIRRKPSAEALSAAEEVEIVFTDRLHIKQHFHYSDTARNIALALDAFAAQAVAADRVQRRALSEEDRELLAKATPRPWRIIRDDSGGQFSGWPSICSADAVDTTVVHRAGFKQEFWQEASERETHANAALIVAAVNAYEGRPQARGLSEEDAKRLAEIQKQAENGYPHPYRSEINFLLRLLDTSDQRAAAIEECEKLWRSLRDRGFTEHQIEWVAQEFRALLRPADMEEPKP